jgi:hypothetical protein
MSWSPDRRWSLGCLQPITGAPPIAPVLTALRRCSCGAAHEMVTPVLSAEKIVRTSLCLSSWEMRSRQDRDRHSRQSRVAGIADTASPHRRSVLATGHREVSGKRAQALAPRWFRISYLWPLRCGDREMCPWRRVVTGAGRMYQRSRGMM